MSRVAGYKHMLAPVGLLTDWPEVFPSHYTGGGKDPSLQTHLEFQPSTSNRRSHFIAHIATGLASVLRRVGSSTRLPWHQQSSEQVEWLNPTLKTGFLKTLLAALEKYRD